MLLEALRKFTGTVVFVSHDRYFIDKLATRIFEIEGGQLQDYPGNYEDYLWQKGRSAAGQVDSVAPGEAPRSAPEAGTNGKQEEPEAQPKKLNPILVRRMRERYDELEEEIARCETEISAAEVDLANFKNAEESIRLAKLIDERRTQLTDMMKEWEQIARTLEETRNGSMSDEA